jgi:hypothetical protein
VSRCTGPLNQSQPRCKQGGARDLVRMRGTGLACTQYYIIFAEAQWGFPALGEPLKGKFSDVQGNSGSIAYVFIRNPIVGLSPS